MEFRQLIANDNPDEKNNPVSTAALVDPETAPETGNCLVFACSLGEDLGNLQQRLLYETFEEFPRFVASGQDDIEALLKLPQFTNAKADLMEEGFSDINHCLLIEAIRKGNECIVIVPSQYVPILMPTNTEQGNVYLIFIQDTSKILKKLTKLREKEKSKDQQNEEFLGKIQKLKTELERIHNARRTRRETVRILSLGTLGIAGGLAAVIGAIEHRNPGRIRDKVKDFVRRLLDPDGSRDHQHHSSLDKTLQRSHTVPLKTVLERSLPEFLPETSTYRDNILDRYRISEYFLGSKLLFTGSTAIKNYPGQSKDTPACSFTMVGDRSGYLWRNGTEADRWKQTTLADVINILLNVEQLSENEIAEWIAWQYRNAFRVELNPEDLEIRYREGQNPRQVEAVFVPDSYKSVLNEVPIKRAYQMAGAPSTQPGGNLSKQTEKQSLIASNNRLLLPSGISPTHDIIVPVHLMRPNPPFKLRINGISWDLRTKNISDSISDFERQRDKEKRQARPASVYGRIVYYREIAPLVQRKDLLMKTLSDYLMKDIPPDQHEKRIAALYNFVQQLPYISENDTDIDRPGLLTLINGGGDCNNVVMLFCELMLSAGYDVAILHTDLRNEDYTQHVMGGIPARYLSPDLQTWGYDNTERFVPIELTGPSRPASRLLGNEANETVFAVEILHTDP